MGIPHMQDTSSVSKTIRIIKWGGRIAKDLKDGALWKNPLEHIDSV
jgi:hypothetical protein